MRTGPEPHATHPTPNAPLAVPINPVVAPARLKLADLRLKKNIIIAKFTPRRMAVAITKDADNIEKLVEIDPSKLNGRPNLSDNDSLEKSTSATSLMFGSHTAKAKAVRLVIAPIVAYRGF